MRAPEALTAFVREALGRGGDRAAIADAARSAGWTTEEIEAALAAWIDAPALPPVPRPRAVVSARDAFRHGLMFFALILLAVHLNLLLFALIETWVPDPLDRFPSVDGRIRWSIAVLAVAYPVWAWMSLRLAREGDRDPGQRRSSVGRWLTHVALFVAVATLVGDGIAVVAGFLGGDLTLRFLLKALCVAVIAGAVLFAYGTGRAEEDAA
jgi:hypothetical protein